MNGIEPLTPADRPGPRTIMGLSVPAFVAVAGVAGLTVLGLGLFAWDHRRRWIKRERTDISAGYHDNDPAADAAYARAVRLTPRDLTADHVTYTVYTAEGPRRIVNDVSMHVPAGSICAVVGESGSGKTTLLDILAGYVRHEGTVYVGGVARDVSRFRQESGYAAWQSVHMA